MVTLSWILVLLCLFSRSSHHGECFTTDIMRNIVSGVTNITQRVRTRLPTPTIPRYINLFRNNERNQSPHLTVNETVTMSPIQEQTQASTTITIQRLNHHSQLNEQDSNQFHTPSKTLHFNDKTSPRNTGQNQNIQTMENYSHVQNFGYKKNIQTHANISKQSFRSEPVDIPNRGTNIAPQHNVEFEENELNSNKSAIKNNKEYNLTRRNNLPKATNNFHTNVQENFDNAQIQLQNEHPNHSDRQKKIPNIPSANLTNVRAKLSNVQSNQSKVQTVQHNLHINEPNATTNNQKVETNGSTNVIGDVRTLTSKELLEQRQTDKDAIVFPTGNAAPDTSKGELPPVENGTNVTIGTRFIINAPEKECAQGKVLQNGHCRSAA